MRRRHHRYSLGELAEPDCVAYFRNIIIKVYRINTDHPETRWSKATDADSDEIPDELMQAVNIWVKHNKYGGLTLQEYLNTVLSSR